MKKLLFPILVLTIISILSCGDSTEEPTVQTTVSISPFVATVDEGINGGTFIGTVNGTTNQGRITYSLTDVNPAGSISIAASTGDIMVADALAFTFESNEVITATVVGTNDGVTDEATVTININEVVNLVLWTGETITFVKVAGADPTDEANQDRITDNVWLTRGNTGGQLFNIKTEENSNEDASPVDTEWAIGTIDQVSDLTFAPFRTALTKPKNQVGTDLVLHLITDDVYLSFKITSWDEGRTGGGGFAYERSTM